jgi:tRNA(Ile)-lysidine synthase
MSIVANTKKYIVIKNLFSKADTILVATSGGADSVVLCHLLKQLGYNFAIAHCNFMLRGVESHRDELFVENLATLLGVQYFQTSFNTKEIATTQKKSIEETARDLRYTWFYKLLKKYKFNYIATAHHADDNVETVVMNFFRGTGIMGLKGILPKQNNIVRPLLHASKQEILQYTKDNKWFFVTDSSNAENDYTRNLFRNTILPQIEKVYPEANANILRNIDRLGDTALLYNQKVDEIKKTLIVKRGDEIFIPALKLQKQKALQTIVYEIIKDYNFTANQSSEVVKLLDSESGKYIQSATHRILKNRNWIIISPIVALTNEIFLLNAIGDAVQLPIGNIKIESAVATANLKQGDNVCFINTSDIAFPLMVRKWKTGDYFYPLGMQKKKKLSRFFIDQKLSLLDKEKIWVVESNKKIVWVIGQRLDDRFKVLQKPNPNIIGKISLEN